MHSSSTCFWRISRRRRRPLQSLWEALERVDAAIERGDQNAPLGGSAPTSAAAARGQADLEGTLAIHLGPLVWCRVRGRLSQPLPLAAAGTALGGVEAQFGWPEFASALGLGKLDVVMVASGQPVDCPPPRDSAALRGCFQRGVGLTVRGAERSCAIPRVLGERLALELGPARVHLFATPADTHGFGWHYDDEHVFIVQTAGVKNYYFRENTVAAHLPASGETFARYAHETSRLWSARLIAGDVLYVPARFWHMARCVEADSLSISIGVTLPHQSERVTVPRISDHSRAAPARNTTE